MQSKYIAHINDFGEQSIIDHLTGTANKAAEFASAFHGEKAAFRAGMAHDIGKYSDKFQRRIRGASEKVDHKSAGAQVLQSEYRDTLGAFCVAGHHTGLPNLGEKTDDVRDNTLFATMKRKIGNDIEDYRAYKSEVKLSECQHPSNLISNNEDRFFYTRMQFSCLVDADYLDTEEFMSAGGISRRNFDDISTLNQKIEKYTDDKGYLKGTGGINALRSEILRGVLKHAASDKGLFALSVPTGGGKTAASMAFALKHALERGLKRVIYVIPYTSIIEQTQSVFEDIFGSENVIAHFANVEYKNDENDIKDMKRLAAENWDAPIILTTSVQFFESLYSNKPSRCRKLHNIVNSAIIFDEAQMIPVNHLYPCVHAISELIKHYGCSAVLCTATQPSLDKLFTELLPDTKIKELCPRSDEMYELFKRVQYKYIGRLSDSELSAVITENEQALCIVNNKKQAQAIYSALKSEGVYHLSTAMSPMHRRRAIEKIRVRLKKKLKCIVISTSLVEAGVDLDFPTVFRAMAGLDSIIQAGGRCNREGVNALADSVTYFFDTEIKPPSSMRQNISASEKVISTFSDISSPEAIKEYFNTLFYTIKSIKELDEKQIVEDARSRLYPFKCVSEKFKLIDDNQYTIFVPFRDGKELIDKLKYMDKPTRSVMRQAGQYSIGVYVNQFTDMLKLGSIEQISENAAILINMELYTEDMGLDLSMISESYDSFI